MATGGKDCTVLLRSDGACLAFGAREYGQTRVPAPPRDFAKRSCGRALARATARASLKIRVPCREISIKYIGALGNVSL